MRRLGRATIGLWNSYDPNSFREAHRRILARAGPLALAFDANLATFGFPFPKDLSTPLEIADWVATTTSIGEDGSYLKELAAKGRFQTFPYASRGFPPQLGEVVLTTCSPDGRKRRSADEVCRMLLEGKSVCLVFGTGPKGTPKEIVSIIPNHLDITFGGYSLETCTALGAVVAVLAHKIRKSEATGP
ncbi:MAG: DUF531 domain-containing protein [Euryarchaeota archaeon]|nr:DUF531 domain-containing protein [Euryarchaeota archaeon]